MVTTQYRGQAEAADNGATIRYKGVMTAGRRWGHVLVLTSMTLSLAGSTCASQPGPAESSTVLWYTHPAVRWEDSLPVGNGRLGAMVFGATDEEQIQLNEDTYWSGGPYSTVVKGGREALPGIQELIFEDVTGRPTSFSGGP